MKLQCIFIATTFAVTLPAYATEENSPLEILIVTGTRFPQALSQTQANLGCCRGGRLRNAAERNLGEVLFSYRPGL